MFNRTGLCGFRRTKNTFTRLSAVFTGRCGLQHCQGRPGPHTPRVPRGEPAAGAARGRTATFGSPAKELGPKEGWDPLTMGSPQTRQLAHGGGKKVKRRPGSVEAAPLQPGGAARSPRPRAVPGSPRARAGGGAGRARQEGPGAGSARRAARGGVGRRGRSTGRAALPLRPSHTWSGAARGPHPAGTPALPAAPARPSLR